MRAWLAYAAGVVIGLLAGFALNVVLEGLEERDREAAAAELYRRRAEAFDEPGGGW
ncbi:MAG TPA: hypothetical protein VIM25_12180 [Candidatus Limnocylindrales bacterium]